MAKITRADVHYVAELAQLELDEAAEAQVEQDLAAILQYMEKLNELDTADVSPMMHVLPLQNVFRVDEVRESIAQSEALRNAPATDGEYFLVPRILETE